MNKKIIYQVLLLIYVNFIFGCSNDNLPKYNQINSLRVLALQANTPEVLPNSPVTITPIISDINGTTLTAYAEACVDLGISYGAEPNCDNNSTKTIVLSSTSLTIPGSSESWTGEADSFIFSVPAEGVIFANKTTREKYNGVNYLVVYTLTNNLNESVTAFKRIVVSDSSKTKNINPVLSQIYGDGSILTTLTLSAQTTLTTDLSTVSKESYSYYDQSNNLITDTEDLTTTWFISDGETQYYRSADFVSNIWTMPNVLPSGRSVYLIAVVHDNRGGVSFVRKEF